MSSVITAFPKAEDARRIQAVLERHGIRVAAACTSAAAALAEMNHHSGGILICGYKLPDMHFLELRECMPESFEMLLAASERVLSTVEGSNVMAVSLPLSAYELVNTVVMMERGRLRRKKKAKQRPKPRSPREQLLIDNAKALLMERNHMTEAEAHRYLQKCSMDNGTNLVETAQMVLTLF